MLRIGIAGAGLLGRIAAWRLAMSGHRVEVFDPAHGPVRHWQGIAGLLPDVSGAPLAAQGDAQALAGVDPWPAAAWTAAGMLSPVAELESGDHTVHALGRASLDLWAHYAQALPGPVGYRRAGSLLLAYAADRGAASRVVAQLSARAPVGAAPEVIDAATLRSLEPAVHGPGLAWRLAEEGQIDTVRAMQVLADAGTAAGVTWHWETLVDVHSGRLSLRSKGAADAGASVDFDLVIDARGLGARPDLPVRGVRGEIYWLHAPGVRLERPLRLLHPRHRVYLVPRAGDVILVGASEIESEDRSPPSLRSTVELLAAAHSVIPALAEARLLRADVNLRPAMPDNLPVVQREAGLIRLNGLFRHGWLIAPALIEQELAAWLVPLVAGSGASRAG